MANDSLGGLDVNEAALGLVPRAAKVGDLPGTELTARELYFHVLAPTSETELLADFGGLRMTATCDQASGLGLRAWTTRENANVRTYTVDFGGQIDNQNSHGSWPPSTGPKELVLSAGGGHLVGELVYWTYADSVVTVTYVADEDLGSRRDDPTECSARGHASAS